jgi:hypothetical protein
MSEKSASPQNEWTSRRTCRPPISPGILRCEASVAGSGWTHNNHQELSLWPFTRVESDLVLRSVSVRSHSPMGHHWPYGP